MNKLDLLYNNNNNNNNQMSSLQSKTETALEILSKKTQPPKEGKNFWDIERFSLNGINIIYSNMIYLYILYH